MTLRNKMLLAYFSIAIVSFFTLTQTVYSSSITKEYNEDFLYGVSRNKAFSFRVKINIETEPDNKWRYNVEYLHEIEITLTYLNESMFNKNTFKLLFHSPRIKINGKTFGYGTYDVLSSSTEVKPDLNGTIKLKYEPSTLDGEELQIEYTIEYTIFNGTSPMPLEPSWNSPEAISVEIKKESPAPDHLFTIAYAAIAIIIIAAPIFYLLKRRYRIREPKAHMITFCCRGKTMLSWMRIYSS